MDLGWVGMTQLGSEEVKTARWTSRQRTTGTTAVHYGKAGDTQLFSIHCNMGKEGI